MGLLKVQGWPRSKVGSRKLGRNRQFLLGFSIKRKFVLYTQTLDISFLPYAYTLASCHAHCRTQMLFHSHPWTPISNSWLGSEIQIWFSPERSPLFDYVCLLSRAHTVLWLCLNLNIRCCSEFSHIGLLTLTFLTVGTDAVQAVTPDL